MLSLPLFHRTLVNELLRVRQYRSRLTRWKLDKNVKPEEMKAIVRLRQQRSLVESDKRDLKFRVRGQEVEPQNIERWLKRHDAMESALYATSSAVCKSLRVDHVNCGVLMMSSYSLSGQLRNHVRDKVTTHTFRVFCWNRGQRKRGRKHEYQ